MKMLFLGSSSSVAPPQGLALIKALHVKAREAAQKFLEEVLIL